MPLSLNQEDNKIKDLFFSLDIPKDIATLLEIPYKWLNYYLYRFPQSNKYLIFKIPKKSSDEYRTIMAPTTSIKIIQQKLNHILNLVYQPKPSVHGFVCGRNVVSNALHHTKKKYVLNVDLLDFFPSINFGRVRGMFIAKPYELPDKVATVLAQICCFNNQLPQGAPTSPIVSNMVCARLDSYLQKLARKYRCTYSRYADDITFSTTLSKFPEMLAKKDITADQNKLILGNELIHVINQNGFEINKNKAGGYVHPAPALMKGQKDGVQCLSCVCSILQALLKKS